MGQTAAEIEYEIERQRNAMTGRISRLERRVRDDVDATRGNVGNRVSATADSVTSSAGKVASIAGTNAGADSAVARHPKSLIASAAAGGFLAGLLSARGDTSRPSRDPEEFKKEWLNAYTRGGGGMLSTEARKDKPEGAQARRDADHERSDEDHEGLGSALRDIARGFVAAQAGGLMESAMDSVVEGFKSRGHSTEHPDRPELPDSDFAYQRHFGGGDAAAAATTPGVPAHRH